MDRSDSGDVLLRALSIGGLSVFVLLYSAIFFVAASAGMAMQEWIDVLASGDSRALSAYFEAFRVRSAGGALAWVFILEILSVAAFGVGSFALLCSWARKPGAGSFPRIAHRAMAWNAAFCALADIAGTASLLASLGSSGPIPRWVAPFAAASLLIRQPLSFIVLLWILGYSAFTLSRRFSMLSLSRRREKKPKKTAA